MAVLDLFAREKRDLSNSEVARLLDLPESSCTDLLHTLHELGFLMRTLRTRRFYPTARLSEISAAISHNDPVLRVGLEAADLVAEMTGETAFVGRLEGATVRVVAVQQGKHPLRYVMSAGERIALHTSAMGKALLGMLESEEALRLLRLKPLRKVASGTVTDLGTLAAELAASRERGWYQTKSEGSDGVDALAISGMLGTEALSISLAGPPDRIASNHDAYLKALSTVGAATFRTTSPKPVQPGN
jgi:DNA-binding IclR family transcriptional regulator